MKLKIFSLNWSVGVTDQCEISSMYLRKILSHLKHKIDVYIWFRALLQSFILDRISDSYLESDHLISTHGGCYFAIKLIPLYLENNSDSFYLEMCLCCC